MSAQGWVNAPYNDGASDLDSGHGTHVAGSVLGDGTQSWGELLPELHLKLDSTCRRLKFGQIGPLLHRATLDTPMTILFGNSR